MARTRKEGKRIRGPRGRPDDGRGKPQSFGRTEKIIRRNRRTFVRLGNKRRRQVDKKRRDEE
jgi:hypothetical protein